MAKKTKNKYNSSRLLVVVILLAVVHPPAQTHSSIHTHTRARTHTHTHRERDAGEHTPMGNMLEQHRQRTGTDVQRQGLHQRCTNIDMREVDRNMMRGFTSSPVLASSSIAGNFGLRCRQQNGGNMQPSVMFRLVGRVLNKGQRCNRPLRVTAHRNIPPWTAVHTRTRTHVHIRTCTRTHVHTRTRTRTRAHTRAHTHYPDEARSFEGGRCHGTRVQAKCVPHLGGWRSAVRATRL